MTTARRARLVLLAAVGVLALLGAVARQKAPPPAADPITRSADPLRPQIADGPPGEHNLW